MSIYTAEGFKGRRDYLESIADEMGLDTEVVFTIAAMLGASEDFDGLITTLEDYADQNMW